MHKFNSNKYYFISDYDTNLINFQDKFTNIIYRNYNKKINIKKIFEIRNLCNKRGNKFYLSNNVKLAMSMNLNGVYLPSFNKNFQHLSYTFKKDFEIIGSAHSINEIKIKQKQGVKTIFLSSIFKKNKNYLGLNRFKLIENFSQIKLVALGGINEKNLKILNLTNVYGFAGISFFQKKRPL